MTVLQSNNSCYTVRALQHGTAWYTIVHMHSYQKIIQLHYPASGSGDRSEGLVANKMQQVLAVRMFKACQDVRRRNLFVPTPPTLTLVSTLLACASGIGSLDLMFCQVACYERPLLGRPASSATSLVLCGLSCAPAMGISPAHVRDLPRRLHGLLTSLP